jgi:hypothetical protein
MTTKRKEIRCRAVVVIALCLLFGVQTNTYSQKPPLEPITRDGLFKVLEKKLSKTGVRFLIEQAQERRVSFVLNDTDEQKIRTTQAQLGKKNLDVLVAAIRDNYRILTAASPPALNQTMTNSPGGIQAGGNVTVNQTPPPRRIPEDARFRIVAMLSQTRAKVEVLAPVNNNEAARLAMDIYEVLTSAGWDMQGEPVRYTLSVGPQQPGILIEMAGEPVAPGARLTFSKEEPAGILGIVFHQLKFAPLVAQRWRDMPVGVIRISVGPRPNE